jgi:hypothetical protein
MKEAIEQFRTHYWSRELDAAFVAFGQIRAGALVVGADPLFNTERVQLVTLAARHALPVSYFQRDHVEAAVATPWLAGPSLANLLPDDLLAKGEGGLEMPLPNFLMPHMQFNLIAAPLGGAAAGSKKLNVSVTPQQQTNWCWAAVSTSVSHFYSSASGWSQCTVANAALPRTDCCGVGAPDPLRCNRPWYLDKALHVTGNLDRVESRSLTFGEVQAEIARDAPLGTRVGWFGGGGHFQTIVGWLVAESGSEYIDISDPIYLDSQVAFSSFASGYQSGGDLTHSYLTHRPPPAAAIAMADGAAPEFEVADPNALGA